MPGLQTGLGGQGWYWQISAADTRHAAALQYTGQPQQTTKTVICTAPSSSQWSLVPGAWVHIMQHASNHHPATIDANIQLSACLAAAATATLNITTHSLCCWYWYSSYNLQINFLRNTKNFCRIICISAAFSLMTQAVSIIETWNMKIRTDWRQLVEVPFSKECEYQNRRSRVLWHVILMFQYWRRRSVVPTQ